MKRRQHFSVKPTRPANEGSPQRSQSVGSNSSHEKDRIVADAAFLTWHLTLLGASTGVNAELGDLARIIWKY